ncbi:MAG: hypothetical protein DWQ37_18760 [Planctomycetota bacterium]|nr:MAG: hypothetical protein DWQ37_18760 [Planctomycetota bacterium]
MPTGKPGDHPYTDIVVHGAEVYGSEIDDLVREIAKECSESIRTAAADLLLKNDPWPRHAVDKVSLREELMRLKSSSS